MTSEQANADAGAGIGRAVRTVSGLTLVSRVRGPEWVSTTVGIARMR